MANRIISPVFILLFLAACSTPYAKQNPFLNGNLGYKDMILEQDTYLISFRGRENYDAPEDILMKLFYRAAEIAQKNGATHFEIASFDANRAVNKQMLPGWSMSSASGNASYNALGGYGTANAQGSSLYIPPQMVQTATINMRTVIKLVKDSSKADKKKLVDTAFIFENWKVR